MDRTDWVIGGIFIMLIVLLLGAAGLADKYDHEREIEKLRVIMECKGAETTGPGGSNG